jgi:hypothetical protein
MGLMAAGLAATLVAGGGTALAATAGPVSGSGVITGCYTTAGLNGSHALVLQDAGANCPKGTSAVTWNEQGPAGPAGGTGPAGATGATGPQGPAGPAGATGPQGPPGTSGTNGTNGTSIVTSPGAPTGACTNGDSDVDLANGEVYTCTASAWADTSSSIQGPAGPAGPAGAIGPAGPKGDPGPAGPAGSAGPPGANGNTVLNGTGAPASTVGVDGDFYIDTAADVLYGPKAGGTWPAAGVSLTGAPGATGATGPQGPPGPGGTCTTDGGAAGTLTAHVDGSNNVTFTCTASTTDANCTHSDGLGQTYTDCNDALGTYTLTTATEARQAWSLANPAPAGDSYTTASTQAGACGLSGSNDQSTGLALIDSTGVIKVVLWYYAGRDAGTVQVLQGDFTCTGATTATWD